MNVSTPARPLPGSQREGFGRDAAEQAVAYIEEGIRILGTVPTKKRIVAERFFDESGGMQLVVHSPYGSRINKAWGFALRKEICRTFDFELQAAATEDGINLSLGPSLSFPLEDVFKYVPLSKVEKILTQAVLQVPLFPIRWRWDASRALAILRFTNGKKTPPALLRMRSDDLLAAVFPEQVMCQDNAMPGDVEVPDHPLVFETMRDALHEAMDMNGFKRVLEDITGGRIEILARDTTQPSVFSHQILNAMPYAFLDEDNEIGERRSRAVALRRALPEDQRDLASLDAAAIRDAARDAWPLIRGRGRTARRPAHAGSDAARRCSSRPRTKRRTARVVRQVGEYGEGVRCHIRRYGEGMGRHRVSPAGLGGVPGGDIRAGQGDLVADRRGVSNTGRRRAHPRTQPDRVHRAVHRR